MSMLLTLTGWLDMLLFGVCTFDNIFMKLNVCPALKAKFQLHIL